MGTNDKGLIYGTLPTGKKTKLANGKSILTGQSVIKHIYSLPKYKGISISGNDVYPLTYKEFLRFDPGEDSNVVLADVSEFFESKSMDLYVHDFLVKDEHNFSLVLYEDCGAGFYIEGYHVE